MEGNDDTKCQKAFVDLPALTITYLVAFVLLWLVLSSLAIIWVMGIFSKRRSQNKALIGAFFGISLMANLISSTLQIVSLVLLECGHGYYSHYRIRITWIIFERLAFFTLLVVVTHNLNTAIFGNLDIKRNVSKLVMLVALTFMGLLTIAFIVISCYVQWLAVNIFHEDADLRPAHAEPRLAAAYWVLYLFALLLGAGFVISGFMATKTRRVVTRRTIYLIATLFLSMFVWVSIVLAHSAVALQYESFSVNEYAGLQFVMCFFLATSYICVVLIGKSNISNTVQTK